jgi:hypothetical protein
MEWIFLEHDDDDDGDDDDDDDDDECSQRFRGIMHSRLAKSLSCGFAFESWP